VSWATAAATSVLGTKWKAKALAKEIKNALQTQCTEGAFATARKEVEEFKGFWSVALFSTVALENIPPALPRLEPLWVTLLSF
jgi:hypothetical protein